MLDRGGGLWKISAETKTRPLKHDPFGALSMKAF